VVQLVQAYKGMENKKERQIDWSVSKSCGKTTSASFQILPKAKLGKIIIWF